MARLLGVVDQPDERRLNRRPIPRLGGLAIFLGILVPSLAFLDLSSEMRGILLGAAVACVVGAIDDFRGLAPVPKLAGQVLAAAIPTRSASGSTTSRSRSSAPSTCRPGSACRSRSSGSSR